MLEALNILFQRKKIRHIFPSNIHFRNGLLTDCLRSITVRTFKLCLKVTSQKMSLSAYIQIVIVKKFLTNLQKQRSNMQRANATPFLPMPTQRPSRTCSISSSASISLPCGVGMSISGQSSGLLMFMPCFAHKSILPAKQ